MLQTGRGPAAILAGRGRPPKLPGDEPARIKHDPGTDETRTTTDLTMPPGRQLQPEAGTCRLNPLPPQSLQCPGESP